MDSFIWLLAQTEQKGKAAPKNYITCRQSAVVHEDWGTRAAVASTQLRTPGEAASHPALISWQDMANNVK